MKKMFEVVGKHLQESRVRAGLSQGDVALKLGYGSPQFISNVERGICTLPLEKMRQVMPLYGLNGESVLKIILREHEKYLRRELGIKAKRR